MWSCKTPFMFSKSVHRKNANINRFSTLTIIEPLFLFLLLFDNKYFLIVANQSICCSESVFKCLQAIPRVILCWQPKNSLSLKYSLKFDILQVLEMYNMLIGITTELERIKYELAKSKYRHFICKTMRKSGKPHGYG